MIAAAILLLDDVSSLVGVHRLGVAAIGVMTLAIMVRASLGHAGQTLRAGPAVSLLFLAVLARDFRAVQGGVLLLAMLFILINLLADVLYALLDPRIRYDRR